MNEKSVEWDYQGKKKATFTQTYTKPKKWVGPFLLGNLHESINRTQICVKQDYVQVPVNFSYH